MAAQASGSSNGKTVAVGISGFGRIGRLVLRATEKNPAVQVVMINVSG